jgi:flavin-dependent dehydrogenase
VVTVPSRPEYDAVVVGARCGGAATAMLLARQGLRVLLLDRARRGSDTLSTHALMRGGALLLHRWGILDQVAAAGTPPVRHTRFHYGDPQLGDETVTVTLKPVAGIEALYAPRRTLLDVLLVDAAVAAGAEVRFGVAVTDLLRDGTGRIAGVTGRDRAGSGVRVSAGLTVGADGIRSVVARHAGARTRWLGSGSGAVIYGYWSGLDVIGYEWFYRPGASAGLIPTNGGEVCVFAGTSTDRFAAETAGDLRGGYHRLLEEATGGAHRRLAAARAPRRLRAFPGRPSYLREAAGPGWALVGDAGGFLDPLSTHGITDALRDAQLLARAVADHRRGEASEPSALSRYVNLRDEITSPLYRVMDQVAGYQWDLPTLRRLLRESSSAMSAEVEAISRLTDNIGASALA